MLKRNRNKRGSIQDLMFVGVLLLFLSMVVLIGYKISNSINTEIQTSETIEAFDGDGRIRASSAQLIEYYPGIIDDSFLFLMIGFSTIALIFSALVRVHPIFIPFFFISLIIIIFISGVFSNIYQEMAANPNLATEAANLTYTSLVMEYLPFIIGIFGILLMIIMFKLRSSADEM